MRRGRDATPPNSVLLAMEVGDGSPYWRASVEELNERGIKVSLLTLRGGGGLADLVQSAGGQTFTMAVRSASDYPAAVGQIRRVLVDHPFEIVHANEPLAGALVGLAQRLARKPSATIFHRHHVAATGAQRLLSLLASHLTQATMAVSVAAAHGARVQDHRTARVTVVHNGVPEPTSAGGVDPRRQLALDDHVPLILMVARFRTEKGHRILLEAFNMLQETADAPPHLVLVGNGPMYPEIRDVVRQQGLARVHLAGHQDNLGPWYRASSVVVIPSLRESFGLVAAEAMACSRAVVAHAVEGLPEVVANDSTGLLVPADDVVSLAGAIARVLEDATLRERLARAGRRRYLERFTTARMVDGWIEQYAAASSLV